jgi:hypothetical protein
VLAVFSGFAVGAIVGMTGVGGGSLMTPLLISVFKLNPAVAIGTDLWFAAITKIRRQLGAPPPRPCGLPHHRPAAGRQHARPRWPPSALMHFTGMTKGWAQRTDLLAGHRPAADGGGGGLPQAWQALGLRLERWLPERRKAVADRGFGRAAGRAGQSSAPSAPARMGATLILLLYPRLPAHRLVGTDIAHAVPLTLVAGIGHATLGHVEWGLLAALLVGSLPGIWLGAQLTKSMPERLVRGVLCASLVTAGLKVIH